MTCNTATTHGSPAHSFHFFATKMAIALAALFFASLAQPMFAQATNQPLDPIRQVSELTKPTPATLPEEYIWTAGDITTLRPDHHLYPWNRPDLRTEIHVFRAHFPVRSIPQSGTLYIAGPRWIRVYLDGQLLGERSTSTDEPINFRVFHFDATHALHRGDNTIAIEAIRGRGVVSASNSLATRQLAYGEVLAVKLLASPFGDDTAPALLISNRNWRSAVAPTGTAWQQPSFNDTAWPHVASLGPIESNIDFFQWSADAGMYGWPSYSGTSPWLRTFPLNAVHVTHVFSGDSSFENLEALTTTPSSTQPHAIFTVTLNNPSLADAEAPSLLLDFGREIAGRIIFQSASSHEAIVSVAYGEDELEAQATGITPGQRGGNYLGTNLIDIGAHATARGPKSAFRYVRIRFLRGAPSISFRSIRAEAITYPVHYLGSFESSDPELNRIWETAAYTAHLAMQDDIWDAPKRDRGRWAGDLDVEARTILPVFGDTFLLEDTLRHLGDETPPGAPVNGIAGYTAQWIATLSALYQQSADKAFVASQHANLLKLLQTMDASLDPSTGLPSAKLKGWGFVDWSPDLYGQTPDVRIGTTLEFLRAYELAPELLRASGDEASAQHYEQQAEHLRTAARSAFINPATHTIGNTWQLNALAVLTGLEPQDNTAIWQNIFSHVHQTTPTDPVISPYFNAYLIEAMAESGHPRAALDWMKTYWGGMLSEGATSFWEAYDLRWPKTDYHLSLQADGTSGFFVSLAHGWSSGPAAWLLAHVLGVTATAPGYSAIDVRPNLLGLRFAHGSVATPHGQVRVSLDTQGVTLDLPSGVESARIFLPQSSGAESANPIVLTHSGHYHFAMPQ